VIAWRGNPELIVSDHGSEFTSNAMLASTSEHQIPAAFVFAAIGAGWPDKPILPYG